MDNLYKNNFSQEQNREITTRKSFPVKKLLLYSVSIVLFFMFIFLFFINASSKFPENYIFNIEEGSSLRKVSLNLKETELIRSRVLFEAFVIMYGGEKHIIPGDYLFENKTNVIEVARRISIGKKNMSALKITIPEGYNREEIKDTFSKRLPKFNGDLFIQKTENLEGYLFPDTYFFLSTDTEDEVIKVMNDNFKTRTEKITKDFQSFGKSEEDIIIMASLIEKEAKGDIDREYISGILWKRFSINMPLQVDAEPSTYKERGLPDQPIANPGLKAIKATITPKTSPYLYYLHDKEGNIHYARNFEEHKANIAKYLK